MVGNIICKLCWNSNWNGQTWQYRPTSLQDIQIALHCSPGVPVSKFFPCCQSKITVNIPCRACYPSEKGWWCDYWNLINNNNDDLKTVNPLLSFILLPYIPLCCKTTKFVVWYKIWCVTGFLYTGTWQFLSDCFISHQ